MARLLALLPLVLAACAEDIRIAPKPDDLPDEDTDDGLAVLQPDITVSPMELRFGIRPPSCDPLEHTITVRNDGEAPLDVTNIRLGGTGRVAYTIDFTAQSLDPGQEFQATISFQPNNEIPYNGALVEVLSNDPDEPQVDVDLRGEGGPAVFREELFIQEQQSDVDVIWAIDNSCSMSEEVDELNARFPTFIQAFANLGLDFQIAAIPADGNTTCATFTEVIDKNTPDPVTAFTDQTAAILSGQVGASCYGEEGFAATRAALQANPNFLRPDATLAVIAVSDEPEQSGESAQSFVNWLQGRKPSPNDVSFSAMVGPASGQGGFGFGACPNNSHPDADAEAAPRYHAAINRSGGVWGSLCTFDFDPFLRHTSFVAAGLEFRFELTDVPFSFSPAAIDVLVNGQPVDWGLPNGWTFDPDTNSIEFHGTSIPGPGASIVITYPYDEECD